MKEKEPVVLKVTAVRNMDVPELKTVACCDNPATGECLNVCCLEYGGKRVLSLATDAVPRPMRPSGGCSLWLDVDSGEWGGAHREGVRVGRRGAGGLGRAAKGRGARGHARRRLRHGGSQGRFPLGARWMGSGRKTAAVFLPDEAGKVELKAGDEHMRRCPP